MGLEMSASGQSDMRDLIGELLTTQRGQPVMVTKFLLVVEAVDLDGTKYVKEFFSEDLRTWEAWGLIKEFEETFRIVNEYQTLKDLGMVDDDDDEEYDEDEA